MQSRMQVEMQASVRRPKPPLSAKGMIDGRLTVGVSKVY